MKTVTLIASLLITLTLTAQSDSLRLAETYNDIRTFTLFQWVNDDPEPRKCWLGLDKATEEWVVMNEALEPMARKKGGKFLIDYGDVIVFDEGNHIEVLNPFTGATDIEQLQIQSYWEPRITIGSPIAVVNEQGKYILPPEGKEITRVELDSTNYWFAMDEAGSIIVDINGTVVGDFPEHHYDYTGCSAPGIILVRKGKKHGSIKLDPKSGDFRILHTAIYPHISCANGDEEFYASAEDNEAGSIIYFFENGSIKVQGN